MSKDTLGGRQSLISPPRLAPGFLTSRECNFPDSSRPHNMHQTLFDGDNLFNVLEDVILN